MIYRKNKTPKKKWCSGDLLFTCCGGEDHYYYYEICLLYVVVASKITNMNKNKVLFGTKSHKCPSLRVFSLVSPNCRWSCHFFFACEYVYTVCFLFTWLFAWRRPWRLKCWEVWGQPLPFACCCFLSCRCSQLGLDVHNLHLFCPDQKILIWVVLDGNGKHPKSQKNICSHLHFVISNHADYFGII